MTRQRTIALWVAAVALPALTACTGVSVGQGAAALSGGIFNIATEAAIVVGRGVADVGNELLDTVPFPAPPPPPPPAPPPPVPAPPL